MKKVSMQSVNDFLNQKSYAFVGVSRREKHFPNILYRELKKKDYYLIPVNPNMENFQGEKCYPDLESLSEKIDAVIVTTPKAETLKIVKQAHYSGIKHIWIQQGAQTKEAIEFAEEKEMNIIANKCLFMFADPVHGLHKFHHSINKIFGVLPE